MALIATQLLEFIRDGRSVAELMDLAGGCSAGPTCSTACAEMIDEVQVEGTFPDGTKLVTVHHPIVAEHGDLALALYGSFLHAARAGASGPAGDAASRARPARSSSASGEIVLNDGRATVDVAGRQPRRSADPGRQPLSLRRNQPRARLRSARRPTACGSTFPPAPPCASSRARRRRSRSSRSPARG